MVAGVTVAIVMLVVVVSFAPKIYAVLSYHLYILIFKGECVCVCVRVYYLVMVQQIIIWLRCCRRSIEQRQVSSITAKIVSNYEKISNVSFLSSKIESNSTWLKALLFIFRFVIRTKVLRKLGDHTYFLFSFYIVLLFIVIFYASG